MSLTSKPGRGPGLLPHDDVAPRMPLDDVPSSAFRAQRRQGGAREGSSGALALALFAYLAAVYLTVETEGELREDFRREITDPREAERRADLARLFFA